MKEILEMKSAHDADVVKFREMKSLMVERMRKMMDLLVPVIGTREIEFRRMYKYAYENECIYGIRFDANAEGDDRVTVLCSDRNVQFYYVDFEDMINVMDALYEYVEREIDLEE